MDEELYMSPQWQEMQKIYDYIYKEIARSSRRTQRDGILALLISLLKHLGSLNSFTVYSFPKLIWKKKKRGTRKKRAIGCNQVMEKKIPSKEYWETLICLFLLKWRFSLIAVHKYFHESKNPECYEVLLLPEKGIKRINFWKLKSNKLYCKEHLSFPFDWSTFWTNVSFHDL